MVESAPGREGDAEGAPLRERLAGKRLLLTGVTGFIGEALLERVLAELPDTSVVAVVRPRGVVTAAERVRQMADRPAFGPLRERIGPAALARALAERVVVLEGDLTDVPAVPGDVDVVVHCAGEVSFDPAVDEGFATNVGGTRAVLEAALAGRGRPHFVQVSTAYVSAGCSGLVPEAPVHVDARWQTELAFAAAARDTAEADSRQPERLAELTKEARRRHAREGGSAVAADAERRRREWVRTRLVEVGAARARSLGHPDCYSLSKALTEQMLLERHGDLPLSVVRPSIVESALHRPYPGWIEGFKMAEPILLAYGRGLLPNFPAYPDLVLDVIPVDLVVSALLAVAASPPPVAAEPAYYHVSSSARNPLDFDRLHAIVRAYFQDAPLPDPEHGHFRPHEFTLRGPAGLQRRLAAGRRLLDAADRALDELPPSSWLRERTRTVIRHQRRLATLTRLSDLYGPYTSAQLAYVDDNTASLAAGLAPADRPVFELDPTAYDWTHYLGDVHLPSITALLRGPQPPRRTDPPAPTPVPAGTGEAGAPPPSFSGPPLAVFDLDGTLLAATVIEAWLWLRLADRPSPAGVLAAAGQTLAGLPGWVAAERTDRAALVRRVARRYAGADPVQLAALVEQGVGDELLARVSAEGLRQVRAHRRAGHRTVLLTGALDLLVRPLAPLFDEVVATRLRIGPDGRATGALAAPPLVGEARAAWLRVALRRLDSDPAAATAYADSASDLPLLAAVGNPVAVNADAALLRHARGAGWPIVEWPATPGHGRLAPAHPPLAGARR